MNVTEGGEKAEGNRHGWGAVLMTALVLVPALALGATNQDPVPFVSIGIGGAGNAGQVSVVMKVFILLTVLSLAPALLIMLTSFTRIVIVLSILRQALGTQQMPPNQVVVGLALFLTFFVMAPVWDQVNSGALQPYMEGKLTQQEALDKAVEPLRSFMFTQTRESDLGLLLEVAKVERPKGPENVPTRVLIPSFVLSELKTAFQIGFLLYVPFLIIDMVVASVLLAMGMMMLPPIMVSLPFKLMLFVLVDGWSLVVGSLIKSFG